MKKIEELLASLEANAERASKPVAIEVDGVGTMYVRRRTVAEFEDMATVNGNEPGGKFGPALARLICDESGTRLPQEHRDRLAELLARQPEAVFHKIIGAADDKAQAPGN